MAWLDGDGLRVTGLPTSYGPLSMSSKRDGAKLVVRLDPGLRKDAALEVNWPSRQRPASVRVDGRTVTDFDANGIQLAKPFKELVATW